MDMCYLACVYRTPSGYCGSTGGAATCPHRQKKQTNADRIRAMSDAELAEFLYGIDFKYWDGILPVITIDGQDILDENEMYEWLKTEVDGGKD